MYNNIGTIQLPVYKNVAASDILVISPFHSPTVSSDVFMYAAKLPIAAIKNANVVVIQNGPYLDVNKYIKPRYL